MTDKPDFAHIIDLFYQASGSGDFESANDLMTDDFIINEAPNLPFGGVYKGKSALKSLYETIIGMMTIIDVKHSLQMVGDSSAATLVELTPEGSDGEKIFILEMFIFRGDRVCEIRPFYYDADVVKKYCKT
ncbi:MAG: nuclear transport factor 2 family protein [Parvibaculales bacterium]